MLADILAVQTVTMTWQGRRKTAATHVLSVSSLQHFKSVDCPTVTSARRLRKAADNGKEAMPIMNEHPDRHEEAFSFQVPFLADLAEADLECLLPRPNRCQNEHLYIDVTQRASTSGVVAVLQRGPS